MQDNCSSNTVTSAGTTHTFQWVPVLVPVPVLLHNPCHNPFNPCIPWWQLPHSLYPI